MLGFRVWNKKSNKISDGFPFLALSFDGKILSMENVYPKNVSDDYILMQFTGIYDWQDKPIYEGDVLFLYRKGNNIYYLVENVKDFLIIHGQDYYNIEKISNDGNIYECPALLERLKNDNTDEL